MLLLLCISTLPFKALMASLTALKLLMTPLKLKLSQQKMKALFKVPKQQQDTDAVQEVYML